MKRCLQFVGLPTVYRLSCLTNQLNHDGHAQRFQLPSRQLANKRVILPEGGGVVAAAVAVRAHPAPCAMAALFFFLDVASSFHRDP